MVVNINKVYCTTITKKKKDFNKQQNLKIVEESLKKRKGVVR